MQLKLTDRKRANAGGVACLILTITLASSAQAKIANDIASQNFYVVSKSEINANQATLAIQLQDELLAIMVPRLASNLTAITWAHAVNSQQLLQEALSAAIDMIEADIVLGKLNGKGEDVPVMAHPPADTSDLTLADFLQQIKVYNDAQGEKRSKGVKLDFKSIEVFEGSLHILDEAIPKMTYPVWLNADIISGPVEHITSTPVDPARFFAGCVRYKQAVLSIGWTTRWNADTPHDGAYTQAQIDDMLAAIRANNVLATGQPITFPVRAGIAANSAAQLHELVRAVNETNDGTLTIWSSENDYVDVKKLRDLIFSFGVERVYLDVPAELSAQLNLGKGSAAARIASLRDFVMVSICLWALSVWLQQWKG